MLTRRQLEIELKKAQEEVLRLRKEVLVYNRLHSLNEAHLALALTKLGVTEGEPLVVTKEQIQDAMYELRIQVNREGDNVSLWCEALE